MALAVSVARPVLSGHEETRTEAWRGERRNELNKTARPQDGRKAVRQFGKTGRDENGAGDGTA